MRSQGTNRADHDLAEGCGQRANGDGDGDLDITKLSSRDVAIKLVSDQNIKLEEWKYMIH